MGALGLWSRLVGGDPSLVLIILLSNQHLHLPHLWAGWSQKGSTHTDLGTILERNTPEIHKYTLFTKEKPSIFEFRSWKMGEKQVLDCTSRIHARLKDEQISQRLDMIRHHVFRTTSCTFFSEFGPGVTCVCYSHNDNHVRTRYALLPVTYDDITFYRGQMQVEKYAAKTKKRGSSSSPTSGAGGVAQKRHRVWRIQKILVIQSEMFGVFWSSYLKNCSILC